MRVRVEGLENVPPVGGCVIASNHLSLMDTPLVLAHLPLQFRFLAKKGLFRIPFIGGEEEKMQQETQKILGDFDGSRVRDLTAKVSAHCNRVPVVDGHTVTVSVEFSSKPAEADLLQALLSFTSVPQERRRRQAPCPRYCFLYIRPK
jgi:hypothetical protein